MNTIEEADNDNKETPCETMFVCRNKHCTPDWTACDGVPICPHADGEDYDFSCRCMQVCQNRRLFPDKDWLNEYKLSTKQYRKYCAVIGLNGDRK